MEQQVPTPSHVPERLSSHCATLKSSWCQQHSICLGLHVRTTLSCVYLAARPFYKRSPCRTLNPRHSADASSDRLDWHPWYPGDDVVDWWGVNIFDGHRFASSHVMGLVAISLELYSAATSNYVTAFVNESSWRGFPVMLGESTPRKIGSTQGKTSWDTWYQPYFDLINNNPATIKAFCCTWIPTPVLQCVTYCALRHRSQLELYSELYVPTLARLG
jgi:hypothetical protein